MNAAMKPATSPAAERAVDYAMQNRGSPSWSLLRSAANMLEMDAGAIRPKLDPTLLAMRDGTAILLRDIATRLQSAERKGSAEITDAGRTVLGKAEMELI